MKLTKQQTQNITTLCDNQDVENLRDLVRAELLEDENEIMYFESVCLTEKLDAKKVLNFLAKS